jgi:hypothetical protein
LSTFLNSINLVRNFIMHIRVRLLFVTNFGQLSSHFLTLLTALFCPDCIMIHRVPTSIYIQSRQHPTPQQDNKVTPKSVPRFTYVLYYCVARISSFRARWGALSDRIFFLLVPRPSARYTTCRTKQSCLFRFNSWKCGFSRAESLFYSWKKWLNERHLELRRSFLCCFTHQLSSQSRFADTQWRMNAIVHDCNPSIVGVASLGPLLVSHWVLYSGFSLGPSHTTSLRDCKGQQERIWPPKLTDNN